MGKEKQIKLIKNSAKRKNVAEVLCKNKPIAQPIKSAGQKERIYFMKKKLIAIIVALAAITTVPACADKTESKNIEKPFGTDFSTILEDAGIEPATDDYIVQCYPETLNIFSDGEITESLDATFISVESYNDNGESIQNEICYLFEEIDEAENYFAYASGGIYEVSLSEKTVFIDAGKDGTYKQDIIALLDSFNANITYISMPYLKKTQIQYSAPEHEVDRCKG